MRAIGYRLQLWHLLPLALFALIAVAAFVWVDRGEFDQHNVVLTIEGPSQMDGGGRGSFTARLANNSDVMLTDAHIFVSLPKELRTSGGDASMNFSVDSIEPGQAHTVQFDIAATSTEAHVTIESRADYSPEGINARFITRATAELTIGSLNADISLLLPSNARAGEEIEGTIRVRPNVSFAQTILYARLDVPSGFAITRVDPEFSNPNDKTWKLGALKEGEEREVHFWGVWSSQENVTISASIGKYEGVRFLPLHIEKKEIEISEVPISVEVRSAEDRTYAYYSDIFAFELVVTNKGDEALRDVVASVSGGQSFVAFSDEDNGDPQTTFQWDARNISGLLEIGPGESVVIPLFAFIDIPNTVEINSLAINSGANGRVGGDEVSESSSYELSIQKNKNDE